MTSNPQSVPPTVMLGSPQQPVGSQQPGNVGVTYPQQQAGTIPFMPATQTVFIQTVPVTATSTSYQKYASRRSLALNIIQLVLGALCIIANSVAIAKNAFLALLGYGFWCGIWVSLN